MSRRPATDQWWDTAAETVSAVPEKVQNRPRRIRTWFWRIYVGAAVLLFPLLVIGSLTAVSQSLRGTPEASSTAAAGVTSDIATAQLVIEKWIATDPSPLPGGRVVAFMTMISQTPAAERDGTIPDHKLNTYRFLAVDKDANLYETAVQIAVGPSGMTVLGQPTILPTEANGAGPGLVWPWPNAQPGATSDALQQAVNAWATAYTSGQPGQLKQAIGDPDPARVYQPMLGVQFSSAEITQVGYLWPDNRVGEGIPPQAVARISLVVRWAGQSKPAPAVTIDVLLNRANTAAPQVVAWAPPGGPLTEYGNAVARAGAGPTVQPSTSGTPSTPSTPSTPR